jgi:hypothetical protein
MPVQRKGLGQTVGEHLTFPLGEVRLLDSRWPLPGSRARMETRSVFAAQKDDLSQQSF